MDGDHPFLSRCVVSFSFMVCSGHHVSLRLLSLLRVMNISPSQKKKKKRKKAPIGPKRFDLPPTPFAASSIRAVSRRSFAGVVTRSVKTCFFWSCSSSPVSSAKQLYHLLGCRHKAAGSVTQSTLAAVYTTEKSTAAGFARALHHAPPTNQSLMDPLQLETLSACAAGLGLGVRRLFA